MTKFGYYGLLKLGIPPRLSGHRGSSDLTWSVNPGVSGAVSCPLFDTNQSHRDSHHAVLVTLKKKFYCSENCIAGITLAAVSMLW